MWRIGRRIFLKKVFFATGRYLSAILIFTTIFLALAVMLSGFIYKEAIAYKEKVLSEYDIQNFEYEPALTTQIYSKNGKLLAEIYDENRRYLPYNEIPDSVKNAIISVEDHRFHEHHGVDPMGLARALFTNFKSGDATKQGASTLTQQVSRQIFLSTEKTLDRKIKELIIALELERKFDKNKILEMYLNEVYFGHQAYGIESASRIYFGKTTKELTPDEAALLVGLPQAPSSYDPLGKNGPKKALTRRLAVLDSMVRDGHITKEQAKEMAEKPLNLRKSGEDGRKVTGLVYPHYTTWVIKQLEKKYGDRVYSSGWKIYTTIDDNAQQLAEKTAKKYASQYSQWYDMHDIAITTINPQTGELVAMAGGADFEENQINMATKPRQPGSTIKSIVYATGIDKGIITDSTVLRDEEISINGWKPKNYDYIHRGWMTIREALRISNNIVAVKAAEKIKIKNVRDYLEKMGVSSLTEEDTNLVMALGGLNQGISPYEMATAYGVFANRGELVEPQFIHKIIDQKGNMVTIPKPAKSKVLQTGTADLITDMLLDVVTQGTGRAAQIGRPVAGKTGTTNDNRDLWFVGYTPNASTAVWLGNADNKKPKGIPASGTTSSIVWQDYMSKYVQSIPYKSFEKDFTLKSFSLYLEDGKEPQLAGKYCGDQSKGVVKSLMIQPQYAPKESMDCKPTDPREYIQNELDQGRTLSDLVEEGLLDKLVNAGYITQLVKEGFFDDLARAGYVKQLKNAGYEKELIEKGYIEQVQEEPKVEPTVPADPEPKPEPPREEVPPVVEPPPTEEPVVEEPVEEDPTSDSENSQSPSVGGAVGGE